MPALRRTVDGRASLGRRRRSRSLVTSSTPEKTPATEEIQKGHMANINRLAEMKKLIAAGPFGDDGRLRGIFVFRVESLEEAKNLTAGDPAVQAGRLAMDIHTWMVPEGILP